MSLENTDRATASELAQEAVKLAPGLVPAAALGGRLLAAAGDRRKAGRILEAAWREGPHPDIADAYADLVPGASARERLSRVRMLARLAEGHLESRLAVARAALDAHEFAEARASLKPLMSAPTRRVAALMAQLEETETGDIGRARQWMARAVHAALDPAWTADGLVAENWMPVSPATGRLDAFQWRVPVAELTPRGPLLEPPPSPSAIAAPVIPSIPAVKEIRPEVRVETKAEHRPEPKPELQPESKPEPKVEPKLELETKPEARPDIQIETKSAPLPLDMSLPPPAAPETMVRAAPIAPIHVSGSIAARIIWPPLPRHWGPVPRR